MEVGTTYSLLKNVVFDEKLSVTISVPKKKKHTLTDYLPKMKNCTFKLSYESSDYYSLTKTGVLEFTDLAVDSRFCIGVNVIFSLAVCLPEYSENLCFVIQE